jgi:hypothetical protein
MVTPCVLVVIGVLVVVVWLRRATHASFVDVRKRWTVGQGRKESGRPPAPLLDVREGS